MGRITRLDGTKLYAAPAHVAAEAQVRVKPLADLRKFVDLIEGRAMACDGPVTPFLEELAAASDSEKKRFIGILQELYRSALASETEE